VSPFCPAPDIENPLVQLIVLVVAPATAVTFLVAIHSTNKGVPGFAGIEVDQPLLPVYPELAPVAHVKVEDPLGFPGVPIDH